MKNLILVSDKFAKKFLRAHTFLKNYVEILKLINTQYNYKNHPMLFFEVQCKVVNNTIAQYLLYLLCIISVILIILSKF